MNLIHSFQSTPSIPAAFWKPFWGKNGNFGPGPFLHIVTAQQDHLQKKGMVWGQKGMANWEKVAFILSEFLLPLSLGFIPEHGAAVYHESTSF